MIRLFASELLRAVSRRLVRFLLAVAILGTLAGMVLATVNSHRTTDAELQRAQRQFERDLEQCLEGGFGVPPEDLEEMGYPDLEAFCNDNVRLEFYASGDGLSLSGLRAALEGTAPVVLMLAVLLGASLVGADWSSGSMATLLTWEPRRVRVFLIRAVVIAIVVFAVAVIVHVVFALAWRVGVSLRGTADDPRWISDAVGAIWRTGVLAIIWGLFAYAAATITRSTAGGVFILLGELVLVEGVIRGFRESIQRWVLIQNATAYVSDQPYASGTQDGVTTPTEALLTLIVYVVLALALALGFFSRRDVT